MPVRMVAEVSLPTRFGMFRMMGFESAYRSGARRECGDVALALVLGDIDRSPPLVRIHSQCMTGDVFHSLRCDCHDQLDLAMRAIAAEGAGVVVYEHQEGRGIGLMEKLRAYELQDAGLDTIEANLHLGHAVDLRDYSLPVSILHALKVRALRLMTNNPEKVATLRSAGIVVVEQVSAEVEGSPYAARYLSVKRERLGHLAGSSRVPGGDSASVAS